jgi:hypothetical protein
LLFFPNVILFFFSKEREDMKKGEKGGLYKRLEMKIGEKGSVELYENIKGRQLCSVSLLVEFVHAVGGGGDATVGG